MQKKEVEKTRRFRVFGIGSRILKVVPWQVGNGYGRTICFKCYNNLLKKILKNYYVYLYLFLFLNLAVKVSRRLITI